VSAGGRLRSTGHAIDPGTAQPTSTSDYKPWGRSTEGSAEQELLATVHGRRSIMEEVSARGPTIPDHRSVLMRRGVNAQFNRVFKFCVYPLLPTVGCLQGNPIIAEKLKREPGRACTTEGEGAVNDAAPSKRLRRWKLAGPRSLIRSNYYLSDWRKPSPRLRPTVVARAPGHTVLGG
jgi:hypothetical protein